MNDRFKFRIWCDSHNAYHKMEDRYVLDHHGDVLELRDVDYHGLCISCGRMCESLIVEQCTGLKDKNGKLIYEGDIVTHKRYNVSKNPTVENLEVYFDDELCEFGVRYSNALLMGQFSHEFEVIGNIHENGDLLK